MGKILSNFKFLICIFFFFCFFSLSKAKNLDKYFEAGNISNYFSGILSLSDNQYLDAYKQLKSLEGLEDKHDVFITNYFYSLVNSQKFQEAYKYSKKIEKKNKENFESNLITSIYYLKNKEYKKAKTYINKLETKNDIININALLGISLNNWLSLNFLDEEDGIKLINNISKDFNNLRKIQNVLARCYYNSNQTQREFKELTSGKGKNFSRYYFFHANFLKNNGKIEESKLIIQNAIEHHPNNLILKQIKKDLKKKNIKSKSNNFDCKNLSHNIAEIFYVVANALSSQSLFKLSNFYLNIAKYLNPNFISFDTLLAQNLSNLDKLEKSKKIYKRISQKGEVYKWYAAKNITSILAQQNQEANAIKYLKKTYNSLSSPEISETHDFANFLKNNDLFDDSIIYYTKVINSIKKTNPIYSKATNGRGIAYERTNNWEKAEKDFLSSLEAKPDDAYVINYLAYSWIEKEINISKALKLLKEANELKKNDGYITDSLGWAFYKLKKYEEAKKYLQLAIRLMPSDPIVNDHYADSLWMVGNEIQARYYWNYALNLKKTEKELKEKIRIKLISGLPL